MIALLLFAAVATTCPAGQVEVHGVAERNGVLNVYSSPDAVEASTILRAKKRWSVCVLPTKHPIDPSGPFVPWYSEVHYSYNDGTSKHERWAIAPEAKSLGVEKVRTDGVIK